MSLLALLLCAFTRTNRHFDRISLVPGNIFGRYTFGSQGTCGVYPRVSYIDVDVAGKADIAAFAAGNYAHSCRTFTAALIGSFVSARVMISPGWCSDASPGLGVVIRLTTYRMHEGGR